MHSRLPRDCRDIAVCVGKPTAHPYFHKSLDWIKKLLDYADKSEREEWGDDTHDEDGKPRETMAMYARQNLS